MATYSRWQIILGAALLLSGCQVSESELESYITSRGFAVIVPPSTLYVPGSLVYRSNYDPKEAKSTKLTLGFLCNPEFSVDLYGKKPLVADTLEQATITKFGGTISAGVPALKQVVDLDAKVKAARSITANISDAHIYAFARDDLDAIRDSLGPRCRKLVNGNVPGNAYQVIQVLQASLDVTVEINTSVDATAKAHFVHQLANFGFTVSADQTASLKGKALFFGVQLEPITAPISAPASPAVASAAPAGLSFAAAGSSPARGHATAQRAIK